MTARVSPERMAELQALADAATEGPWSTYRSDDDWPIETGPDGRNYLGHSPDDGVRAGFTQADAEFIAASRQAVSDLIADLTEARAERDTAIGEHIAAVQEIQRLRATLAEKRRTCRSQEDAIAQDEETVNSLEAERDAAVTTLKRVEALHSHPIKVGHGSTCPTCFGHGWPCSTERALAGDDRV